MSEKAFNKAMSILMPILCVSIMLVMVLGTCLLILESAYEPVSAETVDSGDIGAVTQVSTRNVDPEPIEQPKSLEEQYASVFAWQVYTGDFGVDQLYYLNEQCEKYDIPMEIMLSIICTESSFRSYVKASTSSASGYCQVIKGTAKWVYEDLLKYGTYDVDNHTEIMTTNWRLNMEISCRLMYCLYWNSNQSWESAVQKYYGGGTEANLIYLNKVNSNMMDLFNITIADIK